MCGSYAWNSKVCRTDGGPTSPPLFHTSLFGYDVLPHPVSPSPPKTSANSLPPSPFLIFPNIAARSPSVGQPGVPPAVRRVRLVCGRAQRDIHGRVTGGGMPWLCMQYLRMQYTHHSGGPITRRSFRRLIQKCDS